MGPRVANEKNQTVRMNKPFSPRRIGPIWGFMSEAPPNPGRHLVLIGMMGSGKSSVGRALASKSGAPFLDTDALIEGRNRKTVTALFQEWGEARFREFEKGVLAEALAEEIPGIISTGGGAVIDPANRASMRTSGFVFYLHAPVEVLFQRLKRDSTRPLLQKDNPLETLRNLFEARRAFYEEAHDRIDVSRLRQRAVADEIWKRLPEEIRKGLSQTKRSF
jgi:shikimate kinase